MYMKQIFKYILYALLFIAIIPYFIPTEFKQDIPNKPFVNSVFFTSSDGIKLHAQIYPNKDAYKGKILLVHGLGASTASFRNNAPFLSQAGFLVIAVDLPAFGYSSKESGIDHSQTNRSRLIWELLDNYDKENNLKDTWNLVGHSMGASTVLAMANQSPAKVKTLNLIAGAVTSEQSSLTWVLYTPVGQWLKVLLRYYFITNTQIASLLESASLTIPSAQDIQYYIEPLKTKGTINALLDFVKTSDNFLINEYKQTNVPINLFWGKNDSWVPVDSIKTIEQYVDINSIELFEAGHLVHETSPDFNQKLLDKLIIP